MKILVLSDSHSALQLMRSAVQAIRPDAIIHLGDYFADGEVIHEENPQIAFYQVPGNCDRYHLQGVFPDRLCLPIYGVKLLITHGHLYSVKSGTERLLQEARKCRAQGVLFGHTHVPLCYNNEKMWILNPGSCSNADGTVGLIEIRNSEILSCRILKRDDWEVYR